MQPNVSSPCAEAACVAWSATYKGAGGSEGFSVNTELDAASHSLFVTGTTSTPTGTDVLVASYDTDDGTLRWITTWDSGRGDDSDTRVAWDPVSGILLVLANEPGNGGEDDNQAVALAYDGATGRLVWSDTFGGPAHDRWDAFAVGSARGRFYTTTDVQGDVAVVVPGNSLEGGHLQIRAYDARSGQVAWTTSVSPPSPAGDIQANFMRLAAQGSTLVLSGPRTVAAFGAYDAYFMGINTTDGEVDWTWTYNPSPHGPEFPSLAVQSEDDHTLYVATGVSGPTSYAAPPFGPATVSGWTAQVLAINATTGQTLWTQDWTDPTGATLLVNRIYLAPDGQSVYVAALREQTNLQDDIVVASFSTASGTMEWRADYAGPDVAVDNARILIEDAAGLHVYAYSGNDQLGTQRDRGDWFTHITLDPASGQQLGETRFAPPWDLGGQGTRVRLGLAGDLLFAAAVPTGTAIPIVQSGPGTEIHVAAVREAAT